MTYKKKYFGEIAPPLCADACLRLTDAYTPLW